MTLHLMGRIRWRSWDTSNAMTGRKDEAEKALQELTHRGEKIYVTPYNLAEVYLGLGEKEQALASLEKAYADHSMLLATAFGDPEFDSLHSDPCYSALMDKLRRNWLSLGFKAWNKMARHTPQLPAARLLMVFMESLHLRS